MAFEGKNFGRGQKELTGAVDLISRYKLLPFQEFFCKKPLPVSIADTHYLHNVVGDAELRKGDGMLLGQLIESPSMNRDRNVHILPIELNVLGEAFHLRETSPVELPPGEKGTPTIAGKSKNELVDKDKKHKKKHKDKNKGKDREHKKHKLHHKDQNTDKEKKKDRSAHQESGADLTKKHNEKRKKHDRDQDAVNLHRLKRSKQ